MAEDANANSETFTLLLFAAASTYCDADSLELKAPMTVKEVLRHLDQKFPGMKEKVLDSSAVTVNLEYIDLDDLGEEGIAKVCRVGDEVGIIPPVSSG